MALSHLLLFFLFLSPLLILASSSSSSSSSTYKKPNAYLLSVAKDKTKLQYYTSLKLGTSPKYSSEFQVGAFIDIGGDLTWLDCAGSGFNSSTYHLVPCASKTCKAARGTCGTKNTTTTCAVFPYNPVANAIVAGALAEDRLSADGKGTQQTHVDKFPFSCVSSAFRKGLSNRTKGVIGLSRAHTALPAKFAQAFNVSRKFALCLPSDGGSGAIIVGGGPYHTTSYRKDAAALLKTTPLIVNNVSTAAVSPEGEPSDEYFINVTSIKIDGVTVSSVKKTLLAINETSGAGGTKISTVEPYTVMETSIYKAFVRAFVKKAMARKMKRVASVKPFGACFSSKSVAATAKTGPAVPYIDLVLQSKSVYWRIYGYNSMVMVKKNVMCLGLVDGGLNRRTSIVIGGKQMEDNLVEFDLAKNKLGFSSTLRAKNTSCSFSSSTF